MVDCASCQVEQAQPPPFLTFHPMPGLPGSDWGWDHTNEPRSVCDLWADLWEWDAATCCTAEHISEVHCNTNVDGWGSGPPAHNVGVRAREYDAPRT